MNKFEQLCFEISDTLSNLSYEIGDMSDIGNEIGIIIAKYFDSNNLGYDKESFISGLKHGISIVDGTHK